MSLIVGLAWPLLRAIGTDAVWALRDRIGPRQQVVADIRQIVSEELANRFDPDRNHRI